MGCSTSKLDNLPAVALCRDRCKFLEDALRHSYALADAHVAYMQSLKTLGPILHQFFDHFSSSSNHHRDNDVTSSSNGDHAAKESISSPPDRSPSSLTSDSHIQFDSDSEEEERISDFKSVNRIHPDYFNLDTPSSSYRFNNYSTYNVEFNAGDWPAHKKTPPPPTTSSSAWDFLNFFEPLEKYEPAYIHESESQKVNESKQNHDTISISAENDKVGPTKSTKEVSFSENERSTGIETKGPSGQPGVSEVLKEVQVLFEKASESGNDVLKMFDAGKFRYHHKYYSLSQVSSKMFYAVAPSKPLSYQRLDDDDDVLNSRNLTASLRKLCMWERKLYDEVKAEEKLRLLYARKYKQMKSLDDKGAETLEAARTMLRALSTKIQIAIHVIDQMSISINKLRDEELWPQINDLVHRLFNMWKAMRECHRRQSHIIMEAKSLDAIAPNAELENCNLEVAVKLKFELQNWILNFSNWNEAQKGYVRALNGWLLKCLAHEPEETPDGRATFSPGRIGAPAVFVISHHWLQAVGTLSEKEVAEALQSFCCSINQLLEQHHVELQQMAIGRRDVDSKLKMLERVEQKMQKAMQAQGKKMTASAREWNKITSTGGLHSGLKQSFMAIERFAANSEQAYDELRLRIEEGKFT